MTTRERDEFLEDLGVVSWEEGDQGAFRLFRRYRGAKQKWAGALFPPHPVQMPECHMPFFLLSSKAWLASGSG